MKMALPTLGVDLSSHPLLDVPPTDMRRSVLTGLYSNPSDSQTDDVGNYGRALIPHRLHGKLCWGHSMARCGGVGGMRISQTLRC